MNCLAPSVPVRTSRRLAAMLPAARLLLVNGAGHHLPRRAPHVVTDAITAFLAAIDHSQPAADADTDGCRFRQAS